MNQVKLIERLELGHRYTESAFSDLSNEEKSRIGTSERWAPKDIMGHITAWQKRQQEWLEPIALGKEPDPLGPSAGDTDFQSENDRIFSANQYRDWHELWGESQRVFDRTRLLVSQLSDQDITDPHRFPGLKARPLWKALCGNFYWHVQVHLGMLYIEREQVAKGRSIAEAFAAQVGSDEPASEQGEAIYNLACFYSLAGIQDQALEHLKTALSLNPALIEWSKQDSDLDPLRSLSEFQAIYTAIAEIK